MIFLEPTTQEASGFNTISDFLFPNNEPDNEAIGMFLDGFLMDKQGRSSYYSVPQEQGHTMGYLLKILDPSTTPQWSAAFEKFYLLWRSAQGDYFQQWFQSIAPAQKETTKNAMLKMLAGAPPVALRVALMMDGMVHYPEMTVQSFIGKSLLRIKPPAFAKALRPRLPQMPIMLKMAKDLRQAAPEYSELADAIVMAVFVERMNQKPPQSSTQRSKTAVEAFLLLMDEEVPIDTEACIRVAKSRFKDSNLLRDMLCFPTWAFASSASHNWLMRSPSTKEKDMAVRMLPILVQDLLNANTHKESGSQYDATLVAAHRYLKNHPPVDEENRALHARFNSQVEEWFKHRTDMNAHEFMYALDHIAPAEQTEEYWQRWLKNAKADTMLDLVSREIHSGRTTAHSYYYNGVSGHALMEYRHRLIARISSVELAEELYRYAKETFSKSMKDFPDRYSRNQSQDEKDRASTNEMLSSMMHGFAHLSHFITDDLRADNGFKQLIGTCAMTYLYQGAHSRYATYNPLAGEFLNLASEPLPMLRTLYPEHTAALNTMRKELVRKIQTAQTVAQPIDYYGLLYRVLGSALYEKATLDPAVMSQLVESMNLSVFDYFGATQIQQNVNFEVSEDVFANLTF